MECDLNSFSRIIWTIFLGAAVLLTGCSEGSFGSASLDATLDSTGKAIKGLYKEYMEPQPQVVLDPKEFGETEERKLAYLLMPVDEKVWELIKFVDGEDKLPTEDWFRRLFERFSWISGVMVVDDEGNTRFQHPLDYNKSVDVNALLALGDPIKSDDEKDGKKEDVVEESEKEGVIEETVPPAEEKFEVDDWKSKRWADHSLRGYAGNSTLGPEIYLVQPYYEDNNFRGLTTIYFDPRNLLEYCPEPDQLMILTAQGVIWSAGYGQAAQDLGSLPWNDILKNQVYGVATAAGQQFYWLGRNMGDFYMLYATAVPTENMDEVLSTSEKPEALNATEPETPSGD